LLAGVDEAGRGPLAGPVVAAAVMFPPQTFIPRVRDSKLLAPSVREILYQQILARATGCGVGIVDSDVVDRVNILEATRQAMLQAVEALVHAAGGRSPQWVLIDGETLPQLALRQIPIVKGETVSHAIAAASIVAKVKRDAIMIDCHRQYPQYNFRRHKGYATAEHKDLIRWYGPCPVHRKSFRGVREHL
jgi:ribonuclease HII